MIYKIIDFKGDKSEDQPLGYKYSLELYLMKT